jgi:CBS domain containing-hemolysin-like protein
MDSDVLLRVLLFFALMLMSGFFSGSETALFSLSPVQLLKLKQSGKPRALLVIQLLEQPRRLIATIFIGNEFVNIAASAIFASITYRYLSDQGPLLVSLVSTAISVTLILFLGEITPKNLAVRVQERWAQAAARPLWLLALVMAPLRWGIEKVSDFAVYLMGRKIVPERTMVGEEEFLTMVDAVAEDGEIDEGEHQLIHNIFEFGDRRVTEVMTPVDRVFALSAKLSLSRIIEEVKGSIYSRIPIYQGNRNRIIGVLYLKDLIPVAYHMGSKPRRLPELLHQGYFIPKSTKCEGLFREFRKRRIHLALVVDEYGHFVGLVTMEDLLEELFGEIKDEKELPSPTGELNIIPLAESSEGESANALSFTPEAAKGDASHPEASAKKGSS